MRRFKRDNLWPSPARSQESRTVEIHRPSAGFPAGTPTRRLAGPNSGDGAASGSTAYSAAELGPAIDIRRVAALIGCSPWTVRQRPIPMGLPTSSSRPQAGSSSIGIKSFAGSKVDKTEDSRGGLVDKPK
jgi:hypothetical protein